jgi:hypothetical protein
VKTTIIVLAVGVFVLGLCMLFVYVVDMFRQDQIARAYAETGVPTTDAAPAPVPPARVPERATTPAALRVHTCENCGKGRTYKPGDWCTDCVREFLSTPSGGAA